MVCTAVSPKITEGQFKRALQHKLQGAQREKPQTGSTNYEDLKASVLAELLDKLWAKEEVKNAGRSTSDAPIKWNQHTLCSSDFLSLKGSGSVLGAAYIVESHCRGAANAGGAVDKLLEEANRQKRENEEILERVENYRR